MVIHCWFRTRRRKFFAKNIFHVDRFFYWIHLKFIRSESGIFERNDVILKNHIDSQRWASRGPEICGKPKNLQLSATGHTFCGFSTLCWILVWSSWSQSPNCFSHHWKYHQQPCFHVKCILFLWAQGRISPFWGKSVFIICHVKY